MPMAPLPTLIAILAVLTADTILSAQPAQAQQGFGNFFTYQTQRPRRTAKKKRVEQPDAAQADAAKADPTKGTEKAAQKTGPTQPVSIIVSLGDQHASIYDANGFVTRTRVSTGQAGHRTPTGVFSVIGKKRYHRSNIYSGAPMPFMQRITWSGVALHAGVVPGYPASHGCIRLPAGFAPQLYKMTEMGARVVVTPSDVKPVEFSHPLLPLPKMHEAPVIPAAPEHQAAKAPSVELASMDTAAVDKSDTATATNAESPKLLNPIAYAKALKQRAQAEKTAADAAAKAALAAAQAGGAEARQALEDVRKAQAALSTAQAKLAAANAATPTGTATDETLAQQRSDAETAVKQAEATLSQAQAGEAAKASAAFKAVEAYKQATAAADAAEKLSEEADRRREQVSAFVSRKEGRIFIRQGWREVWEAPVTIRDPDRPLGTHVYSAVDVAPDGSSMRWTAISMPAEKAAPARRSRDKDKNEAAEATASASAPETAAGALDRIELPEGARDRIAELLWTGGSLIVSDQPRSPEMSENATDFIVLTR
jgi:lipoprotein-anchoring transpeptidase ErfK/SrfK